MADKQQSEDNTSLEPSIESASAQHASRDSANHADAASAQELSASSDMQGAAVPGDPHSQGSTQAPTKLQPVQASAPLLRPEQTSLDRRPPAKQAAAARSKDAAVQQRSATHCSRLAAAPAASALPATAGWAKRRMPAAPQPQPAPEAPAAAGAAAQQSATAPAPTAKADVSAGHESTSAASKSAGQPATAASSGTTSSYAAMPNSAAQQSPAKPAKAAASAPERAQAPASPALPKASLAADSAADSRQPAEQPALECASAGTPSSEHAPPQQAQDPLPAPKAAPQQPAEAPKQGTPAQSPAHAASAEVPKPKTWANMAAKLSDGGASTAFKPAPLKAPVSRPLSTASSGFSVQVQNVKWPAVDSFSAPLKTHQSTFSAVVTGFH